MDKMDIITSLEQEVVNYAKQREAVNQQIIQAQANFQALGGAIQALQIFIAKAKAEAAKAITDAAPNAPAVGAADKVGE